MDQKFSVILTGIRCEPFTFFSLISIRSIFQKTKALYNFWNSANRHWISLSTPIDRVFPRQFSLAVHGLLRRRRQLGPDQRIGGRVCCDGSGKKSWYANRISRLALIGYSSGIDAYTNQCRQLQRWVNLYVIAESTFEPASIYFVSLLSCCRWSAALFSYYDKTF